MDNNLRTARYLLLHYPALWAQLLEMLEDVLHQYRDQAFIEVRKNHEPSDTTGKKAIKLITFAEYNKELFVVPRFLETIPLIERRLVLLVWRHGISFRSWYPIGRKLELSPAGAIEVWEYIVEKLAKQLTNMTRFAGDA